MCASERSCCFKALQITLHNGADVLVSAADGTTALHPAAAAGRSDSCELLLARAGSLVHTKNVNGCTAIMQAVAFGSLDTVKILCQYGADVNILNAHSVTPLIAACVYKRADMLPS
jgi:ankyrin repeat protein